ncbi:hypothetical protein B0H11DRAFT_1917978 [Mycena galericulata]|nr:hypothetical protein B0H11DRAFT_1917978 [Mycena galericulata]
MCILSAAGGGELELNSQIESNRTESSQGQGGGQGLSVDRTQSDSLMRESERQLGFPGTSERSTCPMFKNQIQPKIESSVFAVATGGRRKKWEGVNKERKEDTSNKENGLGYMHTSGPESRAKIAQRAYRYKSPNTVDSRGWGFAKWIPSHGKACIRMYDCGLGSGAESFVCSVGVLGVLGEDRRGGVEDGGSELEPTSHLGLGAKKEKEEEGEEEEGFETDTLDDERCQ